MAIPLDVIQEKQYKLPDILQLSIFILDRLLNIARMIWQFQQFQRELMGNTRRSPKGFEMPGTHLRNILCQCFLWYTSNTSSSRGFEEVRASQVYPEGEGFKEIRPLCKESVLLSKLSVESNEIPDTEVQSSVVGPTLLIVLIHSKDQHD